MKQASEFLHEKIFKKYHYTWEDIDLKIYKKILKEEGFDEKKIKNEILKLKKKTSKKIKFKKIDKNPRSLFLFGFFNKFLVDIFASDFRICKSFYFYCKTELDITSINHVVNCSIATTDCTS